MLGARTGGICSVAMVEIGRVWMQLRAAAVDLADQGRPVSHGHAREIARTIVMRECFDRAPLDALDYLASALVSMVADNAQE